MKWLAIPVAGFLVGLSSAAGAAPQTFNTALPVAKGEYVFREQLFDRRAQGDPSAAGRDLHVRGSISVLGSGIGRGWVVFEIG